MSRTFGLLAALVALAAAAGLGWLFVQERAGARAYAARWADDPPKRDGFAADRAPPELKAIPVDGDRALKYLKQLCDLGPRISGTEGMARQQALVTKHFEGLGAKVSRQEFQARQKSRRQPVAMVNLVASWFPDRPKRVILCSHYDTRPAAHEDVQQNWNKPFLSANDGTSGVALLMELAHHMKDFPTGVGVDFVLFDGEEYIFDLGVPGVRRGDDYFLGSEHFAGEYARDKAKLPYRYEAAILLDLFAHENARLAVEGHSWQANPKLVEAVWKTAEAVGAKSFKVERGFDRGYEVLDDHVPLIRAGIPAIDVIDFDYKHWHKLSDTPDKCSPRQLAEVGKVLTAWLQQQK